MSSNPKTRAAYGDPPCTLEELVAPLTEAEFLACLRERRLVQVRSASDDGYSRLLTWQGLQQLMQLGVYPRRDYFRVLKESEAAPTERWLVGGKIDLVRLEECLRDGFSIIFNHLEEHVPALGALCQSLSAHLLENTSVNAIVSTGAEGALRLHFDFEDLIILQLEGRKRWQIFGPPVLNPVRRMAKVPAPQGASPIFDEVLEPGDFLFVPAGYWHHCQTLSGRSIHIGIFLIPPCSWDAARAATADELLAEEPFRVPLTRIEDAEQLATLESDVKRRLIEKINAMKLGEFPSAWHRKGVEVMAREKQAREGERKAREERHSPTRISGMRVVGNDPPSAPPPVLGLPTSFKKELRSSKACSFLDNLSLQTLVAPVPEAEFRAHYWEQKPLFVSRGNPDYYGNLFTLDDFDEAITRSPSYVKLANAENKKNQQYKPVVEGLEAVLADMREGGTLVLDQLHNTDPKLSLLCRALAPELGHKFQTNLYLTPPHGKGFTPHWDNHDVFILQVLGSKHWKLETTRRKLPEPGESMGNEGRELRGEPTAFTVRQGDLIYIPRGWVHAAECGEEPSLHITFGVGAFFLEGLLAAVIKAGYQRDERLNATLPLGFMHGSGDDLVRRVKAALHGMCDDKFLTEVVNQYRDELVRSFPLDISGQVRDFFRPRSVALDDVVGPRRGTVYRIQADAEFVRVNFGARSITFLGLFREALQFALNTPAYAVREIRGDLADEERIVFIERLIEEGLVIRKGNDSA